MPIIDRLKIEPIYYIDDKGQSNEKYLLNRDNHILLLLSAKLLKVVYSYFKQTQISLLV
jgi:hypothetical protein